MPSDDIEKVFEIINDVVTVITSKEAGKKDENLKSVTVRDYRKQIEDLKNIDKSDFDDVSTSSQNYPTARVAEIANEKENEKRNLERRRQERESKLADLQKELQELEERYTTLKLKSATKLKQQSNELKVYAMTSKIAWDLDSPSNLVKGYVVSEKGPLPFTFDKTGASPFNTCNQLWNLIEKS